jgi:hypothetical protein
MQPGGIMPLFATSELPDIDAKFISTVNDGVEKLRSRLVNEIVTSILPPILVPSMVQVFFQGHTRRALMFIEGGYDAFLANRGLVAYACVRAVYETFACVMDFCDKLADHLVEGNFEKTSAFILSRQYAARIKEFVRKDVAIDEITDNTAVNILTQIERVSKHFPTFREEYDLLSERTHPNGSGALLHFLESSDYRTPYQTHKFSSGVHRKSVTRSLLEAGWLLAIMDHGMNVMEAKLAKHDWFAKQASSKAQ